MKNDKVLYSIRNLQFRYSQNPVLRIERLEIERGKIYVFLGPNGSGKTTLFKILNCLLYPVKGEVLFMGDPLKQSSDIRDKTVYVHQNPLLLSGSVMYNVAYGLKLRRVPVEERKKIVSKTLSDTGLSGFEYKKSTRLSSGEVQRVAIARALAVQPEVLLLDEPVSNIDSENILKIEETLLQIKEKYRCTVLICTHNLPFAYRICDELIHLENGEIGETAENILKGRVIKQEEQFIYFKSGELTLICSHTEGTFRTAVIDSDKIILSDKPISSSARNRTRGVVMDIRACGNLKGAVEVKIDAGAELKVRITERSMDELRIKKGSILWLVFKASSVRLF